MPGARSVKQGAWGRARDQGAPEHYPEPMGGRREMEREPRNLDRITRNLGNTEEPGLNSESLLKGSWRWGS